MCRCGLKLCVIYLITRSIVEPSGALSLAGLSRLCHNLHHSHEQLPNYKLFPLDIAEAGYEVDIVEKLPSIGGRMSQLDKTFPTLDCSACILTPKMVEAAAHERINIYTYSEVEKVSGFVGDFTVDIRKKARSVDMSKCTGTTRRTSWRS